MSRGSWDRALSGSDRRPWVRSRSTHVHSPVRTPRWCRTMARDRLHTRTGGGRRTVSRHPGAAEGTPAWDTKRRHPSRQRPFQGEPSSQRRSSRRSCARPLRPKLPRPPNSPYGPNRTRRMRRARARDLRSSRSQDTRRGDSSRPARRHRPRRGDRSHRRGALRVRHREFASDRTPSRSPRAPRGPSAPRASASAPPRGA